MHQNYGFTDEKIFWIDIDNIKGGNNGLKIVQINFYTFIDLSKVC